MLQDAVNIFYIYIVYFDFLKNLEFFYITISL